MSFQDLPNILFTVFIAPLGFALHRVINNSSRLTKVETKQKQFEKQLEKLDKLDELCNDVSYIKGMLDERFRKI